LVIATDDCGDGVDEIDAGSGSLSGVLFKN
jgi:hypothetical protein